MNSKSMESQPRVIRANVSPNSPSFQMALLKAAKAKCTRLIGRPQMVNSDEIRGDASIQYLR